MYSYLAVCFFCPNLVALFQAPNLEGLQLDLSVGEDGAICIASVALHVSTLCASGLKRLTLMLHTTAHFAGPSKLRDLDMGRTVPELSALRIAAADGSGLCTLRDCEILRLYFTEQCARGVVSFPPHIGLCEGKRRGHPERRSAVL
jgi:hypothetical protein